MHVRLRKIRLMRRISRRAGFARLTRNERGVQLAELAIVLPLLVVMFAATAEFGRYFYAYTTLAKGARVGARYLAGACVKDYEDTNAKNIVVYGNAAGTGSPILPGLDPSKISIVRKDAAGNVVTAGVPATVTVTTTSLNFQPVFDLGGLMRNNGLSLNIALNPSVTMRYLLTTPCV
jgi:Flp pilus assembly protein TadG